MLQGAFRRIEIPNPKARGHVAPGSERVCRVFNIFERVVLDMATFGRFHASPGEAEPPGTRGTAPAAPALGGKCEPPRAWL